ncbi:hypothetical protein JC525_18220 [Alteromonas sp. IB21]|uniref:hypothetical protein n=1 Tax=Alteromonas sp. IB21 TaxID=2779369 RepID=UPI0018E7823D|nr:hypothetical protein [Alteromonas sp. IB21]MBJ2130870.1 hypothetical protein [Alteromonas sp. IB21]
MNKFYAIVIALFARTSVITIMFLLTVVITNKLNKSEAGVFLYCLAIITFMSVFFRFGFDNVIIKEFSGKSILTKTIRRAKVLNSSAALSIFLLIVSLLVLSVLWFPLPVKKDLIFISLIISFLLSMSVIIGTLFQARNNIITATFLNGFLPNFLFIVFLLVFPSLDAFGSLKLYLLASSIAVVISFILYFSKFELFGIEYVSFIGHKKSVKTAFYLWQVALSQQLIIWSGQLISGFYLANQDLALIAVCQRISLLISFVLVAVNFVLSPIYASYFNNDETAKALMLYKRSVIFLGLAGIPIFLSVFFLFDYYKTFFGETLEDSNSKLILLILCCGQIINLVTGSVGYILSLSGNEKKLRNALFITVFASLPVYMVLIPIYGIYGSALSTALAIALQNILSVFFLRYSFNK